MSRINCMYGLTKGLKLVKVKRFLKTDSFEIYIPNGVDGISRHYKSNELSAHLAYVSTSYDKALAMQKKLRKKKEKHLFDDNFEAFTSFIDTKKYKDGFGPLPTDPENPFEDEIENIKPSIDERLYKNGFDDGLKAGFEDGYMEGTEDTEKIYEKAYKKVCKQLAQKTIAPKEYWEKWGFDE